MYNKDLYTVKQGAWLWINRSLQKKCLRAYKEADDSVADTILFDIKQKEIEIKLHQQKIERINEAFVAGAFSIKEMKKGKDRWNKAIQQSKNELSELENKLNKTKKISSEERLNGLSLFLDAFETDNLEDRFARSADSADDDNNDVRNRLIRIRNN